MQYRKLTKPTARKEFNKGVTIYILPCKCSVMCFEVKGFVTPISINKDDHPDDVDSGDFDKRVMYFEHYNCNSEFGHYAHYYIKEQEVSK